MLNPLATPVIGASLLAAVALGIHLGESSIGLIHPVHFQGPALHPRDRGAAIDPNRVQPRQVSYLALYGWEQGQAAHAADCGDCEALRARDAYARDYSAEVPHFGSDDEIRRLEARARAATELRFAEAEAAAQLAAARRSEVLRYASYPVDAEEERGPRYADYRARDVYLDDGAPAADPGFGDE